MLEVRDLVVGYGKIKAVHGVRFGVGEGEDVGILGANVAGKSTVYGQVVTGAGTPAFTSRYQLGHPGAARRRR